MAQDLATIEIKLPDPRRPAMLPSLPAWAEHSSAAVRLELQIEPTTGKFQDVLVLPSPMLPSPEQRQAMMAHMDSLRSYLAQTPATGEQWEIKVATSVSKLSVLAGEKRSELGTDAWSEVYLDVLDDVPYWAVDVALKLWFKHDCGTDEKGKPHDYKWAPDPGTLRKIALRETYNMSARIGTLQRLLDAREYVDCSAQLAQGRAAMAGLKRALADPEAARSLTFEQAVKLGNEPEQPTIISAPSNEAEKINTAPPAQPAHEAAE